MKLFNNFEAMTPDVCHKAETLPPLKIFFSLHFLLFDLEMKE